MFELLPAFTVDAAAAARVHKMLLQRSMYRVDAGAATLSRRRACLHSISCHSTSLCRALPRLRAIAAANSRYSLYSREYTASRPLITQQPAHGFAERVPRRVVVPPRAVAEKPILDPAVEAEQASERMDRRRQRDQRRGKPNFMNASGGERKLKRILSAEQEEEARRAYLEVRLQALEPSPISAEERERLLQPPPTGAEHRELVFAARDQRLLLAKIADETLELQSGDSARVRRFQSREKKRRTRSNRLRNKRTFASESELVDMQSAQHYQRVKLINGGALGESLPGMSGEAAEDVQAESEGPNDDYAAQFKNPDRVAFRTERRLFKSEVRARVFKQQKVPRKKKRF